MSIATNISQINAARIAEKELVEAFEAKLPLTMSQKYLGCDTFFHPKFSVNTGNTVFCVYKKVKNPMQRYMFLVVDSGGYNIYWVENSTESFLGAFPLGAEGLLDLFLQPYLSAKYGLQ